MAKSKDNIEKKPEIGFNVAVVKDGPYLVSGNLPLAKEIMVSDDNHDSVGWKKGDVYPNQKDYALCRCGKSNNKPYCDSSHIKTKFDGTEVAGNRKYDERADITKGPDIYLTDVRDFCSSSRYCHNHIKGSVWDLTEESGTPEKKKNAMQQACDCPSGRLVLWDKKTGKALEPKFTLSIGLIEDPETGVSGAIWLKGGIPVISSDGKQYEVRNRVTLCRCGKSGNKPFCDGTHIECKFNDGDKSLKRKIIQKTV